MAENLLEGNAGGGVCDDLAGYLWEGGGGIYSPNRMNYTGRGGC